jgi:cell division protein FtsW
MTKVQNVPIKTKNRQIDFTLCITVLLLLALGIVMVLSASSPSALAESGDSYSYVSKQALAAVLGLIAMAVISKIDYRNYKKLYKIAYIGSVLLLALVPIIGEDINGAKRWIFLGPLGQFQPSEIAKIGLIVFFAAYLANNKEKLKSLKDGFIKPFAWLVAPIFILVVFQDHLSASIVIIAITSIMMLIAGSRLSHFLTLGAGAGGLGVGALVLMAQITGKGNFRFDRITAFLNPWADAQGTGWQITQSLYAIGSGGLFGAGLRTK